MRKYYEYLQDSYYENFNDQRVKREFLHKIDDFVNQKQYVRITLLNWNEEPLKELKGELTSGSMNKDGSSSFRRTCSLSASVSGGTYDIESLNMDFSLNKKVFIEIGVKNYTNQYPQYPILYFPQGVFFISEFNLNSSSTSVIQLSLNLKDKMAGLSGEVGGTFTATVQLDTMDTQSPSGEYISEKVLVYNIIEELVHHWGGEDLNNIVIEDVPLRIKRVMQWGGSTPLFLIPQKGTSIQARDLWYEATIQEPEKDSNGNYIGEGIIQIPNGVDAGYEFYDFVYADELTVAPGSTVCQALDQLKDYLGNFEYFYDEFGVFHFREIKNYLNTTQATIMVDEMNEHDYLTDITNGKQVYSFNDNSNIISISVNPQYNNIKNDYMILGLRKSSNSDISFPVIYHLAIDKKPLTGNVYHNLLIYKEESTSLIKAAFPLSVQNDTELPIPGNFNIIYRVAASNEFFYWAGDVYKTIEPIRYYPSENEGEGYAVKDWRTELYLQGMLNKNIGTDAGMMYNNLKHDYSASINDDSWVGRLYRKTNVQRIDTDYYFEELDAFWPQVYDLENQRFIGEEKDKSLSTSALCDGIYYLDFIDSQSSNLGEYSISNIGRRTDVVQDDNINCLFEPEIPDIVFLNKDMDDKDKLAELRGECTTKGQPYTQVSEDIYNSFRLGGYKNSAFVQLQYELYLHTNYQKTVSISAIPIWYLEPNTRISINDKSTNTYGDYMMNSISYTFGAANPMNVSGNECIHKM